MSQQQNEQAFDAIYSALCNLGKIAPEIIDPGDARVLEFREAMEQLEHVLYVEEPEGIKP